MLADAGLILIQSRLAGLTHNRASDKCLHGGAGHKALRDVPDQINAMLNRFIQHADGIAAEMVRTGECSGTTSRRSSSIHHGTCGTR